MTFAIKNTNMPALEARLLRTAREVNDSKPHHVVAQVRAAAGPGAAVACLGLAFKANVDDLRESPAVEIAAHLADAGLKVLAVEPHVTALPKVLQGRAELVSLADALARSQAERDAAWLLCLRAARLKDLRNPKASADLHQLAP